MTSLMGKWDARYRGLTPEDPLFYGVTASYRMAGAFLEDMDEVEDWGCGGGGFKRYCKPRYIGVDGSTSPFADKVVNLVDYRSECDGIMLRHVLEHNYDWDRILDNALLSARRKLCIVLFTPFDISAGERSKIKEVGWSHMEGLAIPDLSFRKSDIEDRLDRIGACWALEPADTEHLYLVWMPPCP